MTTEQDIQRVFRDARREWEWEQLRRRVWEREAQVVWWSGWGKRLLRIVAGVVVFAAMWELWRW